MKLEADVVVTNQPPNVVMFLILERRLIGQSKGIRHILMEADQWIHGLKRTCKKAKPKKRKINDKGVIASIIASSTSNEASIAENKKHEHTHDCCQIGRLLHLTKCKETRAEDTHLAKLVKEAGYQILFIPKYHCGLF